MPESGVNIDTEHVPSTNKRFDDKTTDSCKGIKELSSPWIEHQIHKQTSVVYRQSPAAK
jgi:hypothetical protein